MKKIFVTIKETLQYVGIILIALLSGFFLVIKMAMIDAKKKQRLLIGQVKCNRSTGEWLPFPLFIKNYLKGWSLVAL